ncbi:MAG: choice-of-anchor U domain-containing protein [Desulfobacterales bacterium]
MAVISKTISWCCFIIMFASAATAGPYAPAAGKAGSTAVSMDDPAFIDWASGWVDYIPGDNLASTWTNPQKALGPAEGTSFEVVSLGSGGSITMTFDPPLSNGSGWDFAIFENSFSDTFLELAYVEVSSDGVHFIRFDNDSLTVDPVGGFGATDPTNIDGFGGKYRQGFGTPFDLADLSTKDDVLDGLVKLNEIGYVRIIDIIGDGTFFDTSGDVIWDPYPTAQSAGFDLDAVGVRYHQFANDAPNQPALESPEDGSQDIPLDITLMSGAFSDENTAEGDFHYQTQWQVSRDSSFAPPLLDVISPVSLTTLILPGSLLTEDIVYYWRVRYFDSYEAGSEWSETYAFKTTPATRDGNGNGIPDDQELDAASPADLDQNGIPDVSQIGDQFKVLNTIDGSGQIALETTNPNDIIEFVESCAPDAYPDEGGASKPGDIRFGLLSFRLRLQNAGAVASAVVYFSDPLPDTYKWYKYDLVKGWHIYADAAFSVDRRSLTFTITDGGNGDIDGLANGIVVDPAGAGSDTTAAAVVPISGSAGIGGSGGVCFIAAAADAIGNDVLNILGGRWSLLLFIVFASIRTRFRF